MAIKFDISSIPYGVTIISAMLSMCANSALGQVNPGGPYTLTNNSKNLYVITSAWTESGLTYNSRVKYNTSKIASAGSQTVKIWEDFTITAAINDIVNNGQANNGFLISFPDRGGDKYGGWATGFCSSEHPTTAQRPKLTIIYTTNTGVIPKNKYSIPAAESYRVTVLNIQGKELNSFTINDLKQIEQIKKSFSCGVHFVKITTPQKNIIQKIWSIR